MISTFVFDLDGTLAQTEILKAESYARAACKPYCRTSFMDNQTRLKQKAAHHAVRFIESGMIIGLGTGSTARCAVERLGELLRGGKLQEVAGIPSSLQTEKLARRSGIPLTDFSAHPVIDITIDGADEVDARLRWNPKIFIKSRQ